MLQLSGKSNDVRADGRTATDARALSELIVIIIIIVIVIVVDVQCGVVSQARGSGYCEMGNTKAIAAWYG